MNSLTGIIRAEIARNGPLPFARFMELALYHPEFGYYESRENGPGRRGDFYTSVSAGELFGQLLACRFAEWLREFKTAGVKFHIIEAGSHDGRLAADILNWLQSRRPKLFSKLEYVIIEPSPRRREWQRETLRKFSSVRWSADFQTLRRVLRARQFNGIIFSNELLDAFPVHRFGWDAKDKKWFEWGVSADGDKFAWTKIRPSAFSLQPSALQSVLPDGYTFETSPAAEIWWRKAAGVLARGKLLAIDYGLTDDILFSPSRPNGTLRGYHQHHASDDVLTNPGQQDITAHVNFSTIQKVGEEAGLKTEFFGTQSKFLTDILAAAMNSNIFAEWSGKQTRQFQTLTHPEHLGRAFRVLVQSRY